MRKMRRRRKFRIALVTAVAALFVALLLFLLFAVNEKLRVQQYEVQGSDRYGAQEIWETSGLRMGESILLVPLEEAQQRLPEALPYIGEVAIKRALPDKLIFHVTEITDFYAAQSGADWLLLDAHGKVLELPGEPLQEGLQIYLPAHAVCEPGKKLTFEKEDSAEVHKLLAELLDALEKNDMQESITELDLRSLSGVRLRYRDTVTLKLGVPKNLDERLQWGKSILEEMEKENTLQSGVLDLSVEGKTPFRPEVSE